jgi:hypothetical protein
VCQKTISHSNRTCRHAYQLGRPVQICLSHQTAHAAIARRIGDEEAAVANMAGAARVVWLDVETAEAFPLPIASPACHLMQLASILDVAQQHDCAKDAEPIRAEVVERKRFDHGVGIALFNLAAQLVAQVGEQRKRDLVGRGEGQDGRSGDAVAQRHLGRCDSHGQRAARLGVGGVARGAEDDGRSGIIDHGGHGGQGGQCSAAQCSATAGMRALWRVSRCVSGREPCAGVCRVCAEERHGGHGRAMAEQVLGRSRESKVRVRVRVRVKVRALVVGVDLRLIRGRATGAGRMRGTP